MPRLALARPKGRVSRDICRADANPSGQWTHPLRDDAPPTAEAGDEASCVDAHYGQGAFALFVENEEVAVSSPEGDVCVTVRT